MMTKKLRSSERGLTFSVDTEHFSIGTKYRYVVDIRRQQICIIPDENGTNTASRKKSGSNVKTLFDIRSREVRELVSKAQFLELQIETDKIVVWARRGSADATHQMAGMVTLDELLGTRLGRIILPLREPLIRLSDLEEMLQEVVAPTPETLHVYDTVSLFCGAGLLDKAFLDTGRFNFVYANDFCRDVEATYRENISPNIHIKDIRDVATSELPEHEVMLATPCCQAFSNANRHLGNLYGREGQEKRSLVQAFIRLAKRSRVFVVENVPQLLTAENAYWYEAILAQLSETFHITAKVVCDSDVGGYTLRKRAVIIGCRDKEIHLPDTPVIARRTVRDALDRVTSSWFNFNDVTTPSKETSEKMSCVPPGGNFKDIPSRLHRFGKSTQSNIYKRLEWDKPSVTIANFRKMNLIHPSENRTLTVAEAAALMGFDNYHFIGGLSAKQQMVANGVTYAIGKLCAETILGALN